MNICFGKIKLVVIMVPMDAIDIGKMQAAAGAGGQARPEAYERIGGGSFRGKARRTSFRREIRLKVGITC
jgi:hypothetical protein